MSVKRRWALAAAALGVVAVLIFVAGPSLWMKPFHDEVARLRAEGFATSCRDWAGEPPPDAENGALDVIAAYERLVADRGPELSWSVTGPWDANATEPWYENASPAQMAALADFLETARPAFDAIRAGLAKPRFRPAETFDALETPSFDSLPRFQGVWRLLAARGLAARSPEDRLAAMRDQVHLGRRYASESRWMLSHMVGLALRAAAVQSARHATERGAIGASQVRAALDEELNEDLLPGLRESLRGEIAFWATSYVAVADGRWAKLHGGPSALERAWRRVRLTAARVPRRSWDEFTPREASDGLRALADVVRIPATSVHEFRRGAAARIAGEPEDLPGDFVNVWVTEATLRLDAALGLARVALAVKAHQERTGTWPETLEEVRGAFRTGMPQDPYTERDFMLERTPATVRIRAGRETQSDDAALREHLLLWEFPAR